MQSIKVSGIRPIRAGGLLLPSNVLMAPLAGYTCYPFRMLAYELGAGLCFTEMCSANALKYEDRATNRLLLTTVDEPVRAVQEWRGKCADAGSKEGGGDHTRLQAEREGSDREVPCWHPGG